LKNNDFQEPPIVFGVSKENKVYRVIGTMSKHPGKKSLLVEEL